MRKNLDQFNKDILNIEKLKDYVDMYHYSTDLTVAVVNNEGKIIYEIGETCLFCEYFKSINRKNKCSNEHLQSSKFSDKLGQEYIFNCSVGLVSFTAPLIIDKVFKGALICGPILMDYPDEMLIHELITKNDLDISNRGKFSTYLKMIPIIEPQKVRYLSKMLLLIAENITLNDINNIREKSEKTQQQSKISEVIHEIKYKQLGNYYPYDKEKELVVKLKNGDIIGAKALLNDLLGHILFNTGGEMEIIKARTLELCTLLSRAAVEGGGGLDEIFGLNYKFMSQLSKISTIEDLSYWLSRVLDRFGNSVFKRFDSKNVDIIKQAINFINNNYNNPISLEDVAKAVHLNAAYFSTLFKKETQMGFSDYLNKVRIEESKHLLNNGNYSILDVAIMVGFEDQSYFSKVFKKIVGITPKDYKCKI